MIGLHPTPAARSSERRVSPPRFLLISNSAPHQTTARLTSTLADRLCARGHITQVRLRALPQGIAPKFWRLLRSEHQHIALIRRADVLVVHSPVALSLPTIIAARLLGRSVLSFVWDIHPASNRLTGTTHSPALLQLFWLLERLGLLLSSRLFISTEDYRPFVGRFGRKATLVPLWPCDPVAEVRSPPEGRDHSTLRIGFAGQINSIRGIAEGVDQVLECWQGEKVELHLFSGDASPEALAQKASSDRRLSIVEHGFVTPGQLQDILAGLDLGWVCLNPNFRLPAFPSKILAYLCAGLPVLYTGPELPALRQWLDTHQLGLATTSGGMIRQEDVAILRRDLDSRRARYFADLEDLWGSVGSLL